ncbi:hypothetical protein OG588_47705 [Streptomyces prunicolor]|nr:hypothetical protein OG588_47705 [Streptomyces prunicolor]
MRGGEIIETGDAATVTTAPQHPYTQRLLLAAPVPDPQRQAERRAERRRLAAALAADTSTEVPTNASMSGDRA